MQKPVIALVGRPNVGKSTLFNRLAGQRLAVVDDVPGTTRDRLHAEAEWLGVEFIVVDTGGIDPSEVRYSEGREPLSVGSADFIDEIRFQAEIAIRDSDAVILMTDVENGVTPADHEVSEILRRNQKEVDGRWNPPIILAVNKCENKAKREQAVEFYELGFPEIHPISAMHGTGTGDMLDAVIQAVNLAPKPYEEEAEDDSVRIAIVGKPNAGKSSLLNQLLGEERAIVSPIAGTTRDSVDSFMNVDGNPVTLIDTAGVRKRGKIGTGVEKYSVIRTMRAIERADVALLMIDATTRITAQDTHIAGFILDAWKSVVLVVNKWDAIEKDTWTIEEYRGEILDKLNFLDYVPSIFISAKTGQRAHQVLPMALRVHEERQVRLSTSQVNKIIRNAVDRHPPPSVAGKLLKLYYGTQVRTDPPTFLIHVNNPELVHFTYKRYLENRFREAYSFEGTPIRFAFKAREQKKK